MRPGVRKESKNAASDSFWTLFGHTLWGLLGSLGPQGPGHPFELFSDSFGVPGLNEGLARPLCQARGFPKIGVKSSLLHNKKLAFSCVFMPRVKASTQTAENGAFVVGFAFLGRPHFQPRGPKTLSFFCEEFYTDLSQNSGETQMQIQRRYYRPETPTPNPEIPKENTAFRRTFLKSSRRPSACFPVT